MRNLRSANGAAPTFALGVVVGALIFGMGTLLVTTSVSAPETGAEERPAAGRGRQAQAATQQRAAAQCQEVFSHQEQALQAADASLAQWNVHVEAMNKLVAGKITLGQARAFWNQTRVGAKRKLERYRDAALAFARLDADCPTQAPQGSRPDPLRACRLAVTANGQALQAADTAIVTWSHHVRDMEMLRTGRLSPAKATRMWMMNWRTGARQLDTFHAAADKARQQTC